MLFISQPVGTGFSYREEAAGSFDNVSGIFVNTTYQPATGRFPTGDVFALKTTDAAAVAAYHILQGFYSALPQLDSEVKSKVFNLWTESYGGHYGSSFFDYFYEQNQLVANGSVSGVELNLNSLGIGNGEATWFSDLMDAKANIHPRYHRRVHSSPILPGIRQL